MITISYSAEEKKFQLSFPYNKTELREVQELPVREWNKHLKVWELPELAVQSLDSLQSRVQWNREAFMRKQMIGRAISHLVDFKFGSATELDSKYDFLRDYQKSGVEFLIKAKKSLLSDDMGLGKSLQAIVALMELETENNLILCPASLKLNWAAEFNKHFGIEPLVIKGSKEERKILWHTPNKYKIANYDILSRDWQFMLHEWDAIIADECIYVKNHAASRTKLLKRLKSDVRIGLSGMPMENNLMELHSILEWIRPEVLPSFYRFKNRYVEYDWSGNIKGYCNLHELHMLTSPYILRRTKEDVLTELPPKVYNDIPLEYTLKEAQLYTAICNELWSWIKEQTGSAWQASALEKTIRLRQFVEFPEIVGFDNLFNPKLEWLKELYESVDKLVVFTYFIGSVERLKKEFNTDYIIAGSTKPDDRLAMVNKFNAADKGMLILTSAGRFGLNLTGVHNAAHFGFEFNPASILQREDRLHRIGQQNTVNIFSPYILDTIDVGIRERFLQRKQDAEDFMSGSEEFQIKNFTKSDFQRLIYGKGK